MTAIPRAPGAAGPRYVAVADGAAQRAVVPPVAAAVSLVRPLRVALGRTAVACLVETRPVVQVIFLLRFLTAAALSAATAGPDPLRLWRIGFGAVDWFCVMAAIYLLNGAMDEPEDRANSSTRPIATGRLRVPEAVGVTAVLAGVALGGAVLLGPVHVVLVLLTMAVGYAYSAPPWALKRYTASTMLIVLAGGLFTYAAGYTCGGSGDPIPVIVLSLAMSGWMSLVGALVKDLSDVDGDRLAGRQTMAVQRGIDVVRRSASLGALGVAALFALAAWQAAPLLRPAAVVVAAGALGVVGALASAGTRRGRCARRRPYRLFMVTQYGAHAAVLAAALVALAS